MDKPRTLLIRLSTPQCIAAGFLFILFFTISFRSGWTRSETDFPNYFTAAVLVRQGKALRSFYDWTWFQRHMNYAGIETQLGSYLPQTPLTMLPIVPLAKLPVQHAKQVWLTLNLLFLAATAWMLSHVTSIAFEWISILVFLGFGSLHSNFLLGQYYVFLLFLLTAAFYFLHRNRPIPSGALCAVAFALKLYGAPFLFFFLAKRNWKALAGMLLASTAALGTAIALFGWPDLHYYVTQILPRSLQGEVIDPYNSGIGTLSTLLRSSFVSESDLNPHPLCNLPVLFFFLSTFLTLSILALACLGVSGRYRDSESRDFAWFTIAILLISSNAAPYTYILLLLPVVLLLKDVATTEKVFLISCYLALNAPVPLGWARYFPKLWILLLLFAFEGRHHWRMLPRRLAIASLTAIFLLAALDARTRAADYRIQSSQRFERLPLDRGTYLSTYPVVTASGLFYEAMVGGGYVIRWLHDGHTEELRYASEAFHPVDTRDGAIRFEVVCHGASRILKFDPATRVIHVMATSDTPDPPPEAISPDGNWAAFEAESGGGTQIFLRNQKTGQVRQFTAGRCNSSAPAWQLDSRALIVASDCARGLGLPVLYRAPLQ